MSPPKAGNAPSGQAPSIQAPANQAPSGLAPAAQVPTSIDAGLGAASSTPAQDRAPLVLLVLGGLLGLAGLTLRRRSPARIRR
ncbi:hypothetical protein IE331_07440 [Nocardioides sp. MJB4]|uniref:Uncharacterized protein n=1 Tax=Nocardioides donggukensis TaxID=2774019 RepID=A0A927K5M7_9ACTN|nr:hypothetical protein [Nocardioides donggukensis]